MLELLELLSTMPSTMLFFFIISIIAVCVFEFVNGFHDTANAVATVIYTRSLKPVQAVVWSGIWNAFGVWVGGIAVAMSIISLLPLTDLLDTSLAENMALVLAVLITAISWNLLTWYFGIPCSSSHTLIGSLLGAGLGFFWANGGSGVNWSKVYDIGLSLLLSPAFGFSAVIILLYLFRLYIKNKSIFKEPPDDNQHPPMPIRIVLIITCTLVSFFHGSNDGQKGVGLLMIILLAFMPAHFALNPKYDQAIVIEDLGVIQNVMKENPSSILAAGFQSRIDLIEKIKVDLINLNPDDTRAKVEIRKRLQVLVKNTTTLIDDPVIFPNRKDRSALETALTSLGNFTNFAPVWVVILISCSLGLGTMIGWKRIVVTIGEKIGKTHLTYAQGMAAEIVAASTIGLSTGLGLPVSTTHVLSSGIAGSMVARKGLGNLQKDTIIQIGLAWVLTLPVTIVVSILLFLSFRLLL